MPRLVCPSGERHRGYFLDAPLVRRRCRSLISAPPLGRPPAVRPWVERMRSTCDPGVTPGLRQQRVRSEVTPFTGIFSGDLSGRALLPSDRDESRSTAANHPHQYWILGRGLSDGQDIGGVYERVYA
jgi:hypothetical protein